jgi:UDP-N-acetylmuramate--alanine ligase
MKGRKIYIVGIGGIGVSALAQLYAHEGAVVLGSDKSESPTTEMLKEKGIEVYIGHEATQVPEDAELLVYSVAVPTENSERVHARELGIPELNYFEALGKASEGKKVIAIAGTHGKTTTTAMIGKILVEAGEDPTIIVGSLVSDWRSNFRAGKSDFFIIEACEYKRDFLTLSPHTLVITNIELDHTDYYKDLDDVIDAFRALIDRTDAAGNIVTATSLPTIQKTIESAPQNVVDYSPVPVPDLLVPGQFNIENAKAAKAAVHAVFPHIPDAQIDASLSAFRGAWRRFEFKGTLSSGAELYDDYAHHPTAIERTLVAAREKFPDKQLVVFFHPHLYSRTRDLWDGFVSALSYADAAFILPVYAAREAPDPSVSNEQLAKAITDAGGNGKAVADFAEVVQTLRALPDDTIAFTMGAGDVYKAGEEALR